MTLKISRNSVFRASAALVCGVTLCVSGWGSLGQSRPAPSAAPSSPYGGQIVEQAVARVNDQLITTSDYDRASKEMDQEATQRGATAQQVAAAHKDLLRNLIDQQLWISKGKELSINGETELIKQLDEIRKKYNLETLEDLEKAAREQGVSYEDFKANIRNQIITQQVMREEVGRRVSVTPGEVQRYFEAHKQEYAQPESVQLSEIMVSTADPLAAATPKGAITPEDPQRLATAKAKADDLEAKLKAGGNFEQLARTSSDGQTAAEGGDLGKYQRGSLAKVLEDSTFGLKPGEFTEPIRTKQGYVILKVVAHVPGGVPQFKDVEPQVEETFYMSRMEPAMRAYLTQMREEAYIEIRPGYTDTAATPNELKPTITNSAYTPPAPKKKKKVQRTRFRETERSFRRKDTKDTGSGTQTAAATPAAAAVPAAAGSGTPADAGAAPQSAGSGETATAETTGAAAAGVQGTPPSGVAPDSSSSSSASSSSAASKKSSAKTVASSATPATMKPGKKEKIRYGQAPRETLPSAAETKVEDAGALPKVAENSAEADSNLRNPLEPAPEPVKKSRYAARSKLPKAPKPKGPVLDSFTPAPPEATEVADTQTQSGPLGLAGDTTKNKKKKKSVTATTGEKTRMQERPKTPTQTTPLEETPTGPIQGAPAPLTAPKSDTSNPDSTTTNPTTKSTPGTSAPQQTPTSPDPPLATTPASEPPH